MSFRQLNKQLLIGVNVKTMSRQKTLKNTATKGIVLKVYLYTLGILIATRTSICFWRVALSNSLHSVNANEEVWRIWQSAAYKKKNWKQLNIAGLNHVEIQIAPSHFHWRIKGPLKRPLCYFIPLDAPGGQRQFDVAQVERFTLGENLQFFWHAHSVRKLVKTLSY